jgi:hypothetical protein
MANRSNRRRESLSRVQAFEAAIAISPRRADAHHGQEAASSTNRSDIRAQSHLRASNVIRSCYPCVVDLISIPVAKTGGPIHPRTECNALSTAARPPASVRGALPGGQPWITLRLTPIRPPPTPKKTDLGLIIGRSPYTPYAGYPDSATTSWTSIAKRQNRVRCHSQMRPTQQALSVRLD